MVYKKTQISKGQKVFRLKPKGKKNPRNNLVKEGDKNYGKYL